MNNITEFIRSRGLVRPDTTSVVPVVPVTPNVVSKSKLNIVTIALVSSIVMVILFIIYKNMHSTNITDSDSGSLEEFKRSQYKSNLEVSMDPLTKCGWEVVLSPSCPYCVKQKQILTQYFPTFKNIFTDKPVEVVPTWINSKTGQTLQGMQTYEKLLEMSKC